MSKFSNKLTDLINNIEREISNVTKTLNFQLMYAWNSSSLKLQLQTLEQQLEINRELLDLYLEEQAHVNPGSNPVNADRAFLYIDTTLDSLQVTRDKQSGIVNAFRDLDYKSEAERFSSTLVRSTDATIGILSHIKTLLISQDNK